MKKRKADNTEKNDLLQNAIEKYLSGYADVSDEARALADKVSELIDTLEEYENYKNFDSILAKADKRYKKAKRAYVRLKTQKRLERYLGAELNRGILVGKHKRLSLEALEAKLKSFEGFIDRKYWDLNVLFGIEYNLLFCSARSVEEAIKIYERRHKN